MSEIDTPVLVRHPVLVIGLPAYNEERHLQRAIESLIAQTWTDFAVLISDNASTDSTAAIAQAAVEADSRFHYYRQDANIGGSGNFNFLRRATDSPFIMWLGAHDAVEPMFLAKCLHLLLSDPSVSLAYTHTQWIDDAGKRLHVTTSPGADRMPDHPIARFVLTMRRIEWCTEINNVIRRDFLDALDFENVYGCDLIMLSHLAYRGPFRCVAEPLYLRWRREADTEAAYMERLTTATGKRPDYPAFIRSYQRRLEALAPDTAARHLASFVLKGLLEHKFIPERPGSLGRLLGWAAAIKRPLLRLRRKVSG